MNILWVLSDNHHQADLVCGRVSHFPFFGQDSITFSKDHAGLGPDGDIRGGLHEQLHEQQVVYDLK